MTTMDSRRGFKRIAPYVVSAAGIVPALFTSSVTTPVVAARTDDTSDHSSSFHSHMAAARSIESLALTHLAPTSMRVAIDANSEALEAFRGQGYELEWEDLLDVALVNDGDWRELETEIIYNTGIPSIKIDSDDI